MTTETEAAKSTVPKSIKFGITFVVVHSIQVETNVCIVSKIYIPGRKQLVKDYKILIR